jgi:hypothetical protein
MRGRIAGLLACAALAAQDRGQLDFLNPGRPVLDAHNRYPYEGRCADHIDQALNLGFPVAIEQDFSRGVDPTSGKARPVVSHSSKTSGGEPTLRAYFFERVRPLVEQALAANGQSRGPLIALRFDFKSCTPFGPTLHSYRVPGPVSQRRFGKVFGLYPRVATSV